MLSTSAACPSGPYDSHCRSVVGLERTKPGAMLLTVMPHGPSSCASCRVRPICAALADAYAWMPVRLTPRPAPLEMLTMRPKRAAFMPAQPPGEIERAGHVHVKDALPLLRRHLLQRPADLPEHAAGVVHEDVDAAVRPPGLGDKRVDRRLVADVHPPHLALPAGFSAQPLRLQQFVLQDIARPHVRTPACKGQR